MNIEKIILLEVIMIMKNKERFLDNLASQSKLCIIIAEQGYTLISRLV